MEHNHTIFLIEIEASRVVALHHPEAGILKVLSRFIHLAGTAEPGIFFRRPNILFGHTD
jgi:hypothetical protein